MEEVKEMLGIDLEEIRAIISYEKNEREVHNNFESEKEIDGAKYAGIKNKGPIVENTFHLKGGIVIKLNEDGLKIIGGQKNALRTIKNIQSYIDDNPNLDENEKNICVSLKNMIEDYSKKLEEKKKQKDNGSEHVPNDENNKIRKKPILEPMDYTYMGRLSDEQIIRRLLREEVKLSEEEINATINQYSLEMVEDGAYDDGYDNSISMRQLIKKEIVEEKKPGEKKPSGKKPGEKKPDDENNNRKDKIRNTIAFLESRLDEPDLDPVDMPTYNRQEILNQIAKLREEMDSLEKKPDKKKPNRKKPGEKKPGEKKPGGKKPSGKKPDEKKPDEKKPDEKKPDQNPNENTDKNLIDELIIFDDSLRDIVVNDQQGYIFNEYMSESPSRRVVSQNNEFDAQINQYRTQIRHIINNLTETENIKNEVNMILDDLDRYIPEYAKEVERIRLYNPKEDLSNGFHKRQLELLIQARDRIKKELGSSQKEGPENKPEEKGPENKPEEKGPENKPEEKGPENKPQEKRPENKPEEKGPENKPEEKGPENKPEEKGPENKPQEKGPENKPQEKGPENKPEEKGPENKPEEKGPENKPEGKETESGFSEDLEKIKKEMKSILVQLEGLVGKKDLEDKLIKLSGEYKILKSKFEEIQSEMNESKLKNDKPKENEEKIEENESKENEEKIEENESKENDDNSRLLPTINGAEVYAQGNIFQKYKLKKQAFRHYNNMDKNSKIGLLQKVRLLLPNKKYKVKAEEFLSNGTIELPKYYEEDSFNFEEIDKQEPNYKRVKQNDLDRYNVSVDRLDIKHQENNMQTKNLNDQERDEDIR